MNDHLALCHPASRRRLGRNVRRPIEPSKKISPATRAIRTGLFHRLRGLQHGQIEFLDPEVAVRLGERSDDNLTAQLQVHDSAFYSHLLSSGSLGLAESYLQQQWSTDDLMALLRIFARNLDNLKPVDGGVARLGRAVANVAHRLSPNSRLGSRRNIASHYDLSNDFFGLFLDSTMMYSSALFEKPGMTLEQASVAKLEAICRKLELGPEDHVVEIGTGWGGFAAYAARNYGCRVTTTTISKEQVHFARRRIKEAGLSDRVTVLFDDYRDLSGRFDKLVSIEMLEAVGHRYYDTFFACCNRLLRGGGRMVIQSITIPEQRFDRYVRSVDFIQKYVFPGGSLPSIASIQRAVGRSTHLRLVGQQDFGLGYARTLSEWRRRFFHRLADVRRLGFDERFIRMWEYYLCYSEAAFRERAVGVSQFVWTKV